MTDKGASQIREEFLKYFEDRGHTVVPSSPLIPADDPTLLFTNAGMVQFKDVFLGLESRSYKRAVTSQKCVRAGGKHNDLENVGFTGRHNTFFEMLGNFSFGDYFKKEAIEYAWEFLTKVMDLPKNRLYVTVYKDDDEAGPLWEKIGGVPSSRIIRLGDKDNFWSMGETGPCGPCSEIVMDRGESFGCGPDCGIGKCDCDRYLEIWNLVFMQYDRDEQGTMKPLPKPSIDTGMSLERIASVVAGSDTSYGIDLFIPIIDKIEQITGSKQAGREFPYRVIADHIRACVFLACDGVQPSNEGRGYVMRRILRRAVRFGKVLGIEEPFLSKLVPVVTGIMKDAYPELEAKEEYISRVLEQDETRFLNTLEEGQKKAEDVIHTAVEQGRDSVPGRDAFVLYDTFGFPIDLTKDMAREKGLAVNEEEFDDAMREQRERSKKGSQDNANNLLELHELVSHVAPTGFIGYECLSGEGKILAILKQNQRVTHISAGEEALVVLNKTPFYAIAGGQVTDTGTLHDLCHDSRVLGRVSQVTKTPGGIYFHKILTKSLISEGQVVHCRVDVERRKDIQRHHTATHILHKAIRSVLGDHATQSGSLVEERRLRFDYSHFSAPTPGELKQIVTIANDIVLADVPVSVKETTPEDAVAGGAIALFGEKYGEKVRVVEVSGYSQELCGGTHVGRTGEIGQIQIISESSLAAGVRRLEAVAGRHALFRVELLDGLLLDLASVLNVSINSIPGKVSKLMSTVDSLEKEVDRLKKGNRSDIAGYLLNSAEIVDPERNRKVVVSRQDNMSVNELRDLGDRLRDQGVTATILGSAGEGRVFLLVMVDPDAIGTGVDAVKIVKSGAELLGGSGGGKSHMAQAGGKNVENMGKALEAARQEAIRLILKGK